MGDLHIIQLIFQLVRLSTYLILPSCLSTVLIIFYDLRQTLIRCQKPYYILLSKYFKYKKLLQLKQEKQLNNYYN